MKKETLLTSGPIYKTLVKFSLPIILSLFLQSLYGAVDLLVVGRFATTADVSGVSTGSQLMMTLTYTVASMAMGITVLVGQKIGAGKAEDAGRAIGAGIVLFFIISVFMTFATEIAAPLLADVLNTPQEALSQTLRYIRICSAGWIFIIAYNIFGCIFRGIGDSETPLKTVTIAAVLNIFADILFVKGFGMGASGAALATVISQAISVLVSVILLKKRHDVPVVFRPSFVRFDRPLIKKELTLGIPIAIQDFLVGISFMVILGVVNRLGLVASAGIGVAEKVCAFIMLIPSAFSQSMTAFVAQNVGADNPERSKTALKYGILTSLAFGLVMFYLTFFHGDVMACVFAKDRAVIEAAHSYLKAYAIDCTLTSFMFCMVGYFNGWGKTTFVMIQGIVGAFCIRLPLAIIFGSLENTSLFLIGLSTPCSTFVQIILCSAMLIHMRRVGKNC